MLRGRLLRWVLRRGILAHLQPLEVGPELVTFRLEHIDELIGQPAIGGKAVGEIVPLPSHRLPLRRKATNVLCLFTDLRYERLQPLIPNRLELRHRGRRDHRWS